MADPVSPLREERVAGGYAYLLSLPSAPPPGGRPPLLLFLHGLRERGSNVWDICRQGLPKFLHGQPDLSAVEIEAARTVAAQFVFAAPQCPADEVWEVAPLLAVVDDVQRRFATDPARTYATGLSMGGFGTWALGLRQPRRFAAIAPVCGGGRLADLSAMLRSDPAALRSLGVWAFHGARDRVIPLEESERMIEALRDAGVADVNLTVYPEAQHDSWTAAYTTPELYPWLLRHGR